MLHIFEGIDAGENPYQNHHNGKEPSKVIHMEVKIQILAEGEQQQLRSFENSGQTQRRGNSQTQSGSRQQKIPVFKFRQYQKHQTPQEGN